MELLCFCVSFPRATALLVALRLPWSDFGKSGFGSNLTWTLQFYLILPPSSMSHCACYGNWAPIWPFPVTLIGEIVTVHPFIHPLFATPRRHVDPIEEMRRRSQLIYRVDGGMPGWMGCRRSVAGQR